MNKGKKTKILLLIILVVFVLVSFAISLRSNDSESRQTEKTEVISEEVSLNSKLIQCFDDSEVIIYCTSACPSCSSLINNFGGYEEAALIFVDCLEERERCDEEKQSEDGPSIQIGGVLFEDEVSLENIAKITGCE